MVEEILKILSVISVSSFKHTFLGIPLAAGYGYNLLEVTLYTALGGTIGLIGFMYFSKFVLYWYKRFFPKKRRKFTRMNRFIVRVRQRFGLYGIAFITPPLLSIPIGTLIASSIYSNKKRVFLFLFTSILFWSFAGACLTRPIAKAVVAMLGM